MAALSKGGLRDWLVQRISAVIIGIYAIGLMFYLFRNQPLYFAQWDSLHQHLFFRIATLIVLVSVLWHAWIGLWTVFTDYVKCVPVRFILQVIVLMLLLGYVAWGVEALWA